MFDYRNNTLPFKCELVSSCGHLLVLTSSEPSHIYLFTVKRVHINLYSCSHETNLLPISSPFFFFFFCCSQHRSTLRLRLHQTIGPLAAPLSCVAVTPTHLVACQMNNIKLWDVKPIETPKANDRTPIRKSGAKKEKEREKEKEKELSVATGVELSGMHPILTFYSVTNHY